MPAPAHDDALLIATSLDRRRALQEVLTALGWRVDAAPNPQAALERLRGRTYAAVFCDAALRGASAGGFLAWARRVAPGRPFYLFAGHGAAGTPAGADAVLPFPPAPEGLPRPEGAPAAPEPARGTDEAPLSGNTSLVPLPDVLEMMGLAGQSARVEIGDGRGTIWLERGTVVHVAQMNGREGGSGLAALAELIQIEDADFRVLPYQPPARPTVNLAVAKAVTEAARLADERARYATLLERVRELCPQTRDAAVGYGLANTPACALGDGDAAFGAARALLEATRGALGGTVNEALAASPPHAVAARTFGDGNLLAARGPAPYGLHLLQALRRALRDIEGG